MIVKRACAILAFSAALAFAQTDGITVSASKTVELPPDETTFQIGVQAESDVGLDKVLEVLQPLDAEHRADGWLGPGPRGKQRLEVTGAGDFAQRSARSRHFLAISASGARPISPDA